MDALSYLRGLSKTGVVSTTKTATDTVHCISQHRSGMPELPRRYLRHSLRQTFATSMEIHRYGRPGSTHVGITRCSSCYWTTAPLWVTRTMPARQFVTSR